MNKINITLKMAFLSLWVWSCEYNQLETPIDCAAEGPKLSLIKKANANCGESNGSVELSATGGIAPFVFSANNLGSNSDGIFTKVPAGSYSFSVSDANGCQHSLEIGVENTDGVSISKIDLKQAGCGSSVGEIEISGSGGTPPYSYKINSAPAQSTGIFSLLAAGKYTISILDDAGCEFSQEATIQSGISLSSHISSIVSTNCAISGCHNGSVSPDLRTSAAIISNANRIRSETASKSMPRGRTLTQTQIDQIACWVSDGAQNN
jgi:hypothetical protein